MRKARIREILERGIFGALIFLLTFSLVSCTSLFPPDSRVSSSQKSLTLPSSGEQARTGDTATEKAVLGEGDARYLIKNRTISLEVKDVSRAAGEVENIAKRFGGYISNQNLSVSYSYQDGPVPLGEVRIAASKDFLQGFVEVRVPAGNFDKFSLAVKKVGRVLDDVISTQEVTQEYVDLKARIKNLERQETQYLEILKKSGKIADILAVEKELERVRGEIESLKSRQMVLEKNIEMASVRVELKKEEGLVAPPLTGWGFKEAWQQAIKNFVGSINTMIILTGRILPYLIALVILYFLLRLVTPYLNRLSIKKKKALIKKGS